ncbi:AAA+ family ATPase [Frigidibacter sp. ROC022]|uniref:AAA+ family ATPase n=1 Tax=Frigidibacter sp. ROC022 TaxID=2971796 RepID=UPI00215AA6C7|nr:AAA+ family ATPase [Frigidibacter sp. ROC022]MCR8722976.1 AAA+ family ATPase [Frigidibacter sp. ROC022]
MSSPFRLTLPIALAAALAAPVAHADGDADEGLDLMQEGAKMIFRHMMRDMGPQISQMESLARILGDWEQYEMPEVLPNGDILIRRKPPGVPPGLQGPPGEGEIDL